MFYDSLGTIKSITPEYEYRLNLCKNKTQNTTDGFFLISLNEIYLDKISLNGNLKILNDSKNI